MPPPPPAPSRRSRRRWALVIVNAAVLFGIAGTWSAVSQHERVLDDDTTRACLVHAAGEPAMMGVSIDSDISQLRFVAKNTIEFAATPAPDRGTVDTRRHVDDRRWADKSAGGRSVTVRCRLTAEGDTFDDALTVLDTEIVR